MDGKENRDKEEQLLEEEIKNMMDDVAVPPSLEPEAVEKLLEEKRKERNRKRWQKYAGIAAAACLCLAAGISAGLNKSGNAADTTVGSAAGNPSAASSETDAASRGNGKESDAGETQITAARDYDEIYEYISAAQKQQARISGGMISDGVAAEEAADTNAASLDAGTAYSGSASAQSDGTAYSETNVREEGVGEADIVKTDGQSLYLLNGQNVQIIGIASGQMEELAEISMDNECQVRELYVEDGRLAILYYKTEYNDGESGYDGYYSEYTCTDVYDITDPAAPEKLGTISQSGYYNTMRVKDGYVYVLSNFYADGAAARANIGAYIPEVQGNTLDAADIYLPQGKAGNEYTVISAFSLSDPTEKTDSKAVFGISGICYVSSANIYITEAYYGTADVTQTSVRKVAYHDGTLEGAAQTKIDGTLDDSFCIDEYNGYLRMVTTVEPCGTEGGISPLFEAADSLEQEDTTSNSLYVLNEKLETVGEITDLAREERVYSARFMGDVGYFVTFRQVDPLFSVDLSDPEEPQIIGQLKIPGFSEYLHPYGEGRLLGIGMEVDEEGVTTEGAKLSMFDISDPADVKEGSKYVLEDIYGIDVYDYKSVFIDTAKNLFGFLTYGNSAEYHVFTYSETDGFQELLSRQLNGWGTVRGMYIGDCFYLIAGNTVESYTLSDFEKIDDIVL